MKHVRRALYVIIAIVAIFMCVCQCVVWIVRAIHKQGVKQE